MAPFQKYSTLLILLIFLWEAPRHAFSTTNDDIAFDPNIVIYPRKVYVRVNNDLDQSLKLTIDCKSKDDDLGKKELPPKGYLYWNFRPNIFGTTLFFCSMSSVYGTLSFDVYKFKRDYNGRCPNDCFWSVRSDGVHGTNENTLQEDLFFKWTP
ncbi:hypothetical protein Nepgr_010096 [Nepenthes gracilis]|uniref:S-protein homolog n=1 Tax=Nepenthes gracilis TaxID=150966 RepID=A0AAD3SCF2_NEPGR|nr:hypothetical protein Nepgr_010096 [Nepenthes gracilis]